MARDDKARTLAATLREALQRRSDEERDAWLREITESLDEGRIVRALRTSSRPPEPGTTFPPELAARLTEAAGVAMAADVAPDRWAAVLDAVLTSPVRKTVQPRALPGLAPLLGIDRPSVGDTGRAARAPKLRRPVATSQREPEPAPDASA
jgi:hypothetical protein